MTARPGHPLVISHRANMGTMPENTLAGIDAALADDVDGVEVDVRATRDGVAVLMHDATLERVTGDARELSAVAAEELAGLRVSGRDGGEARPVPTLAEALARIAGRYILVIEMKERGIVAAAAEAVRAAGAASWCWVWASDPTVCAASRAALPESPAALIVGARSTGRPGLDHYVELAARSGLAAVNLHRSLATGRAVEEAHRAGLAVYCWTVNEPDEIERVIAAGVDAVCGDYPPRITTIAGRGSGTGSGTGRSRLHARRGD